MSKEILRRYMYRGGDSQLRITIETPDKQHGGKVLEEIHNVMRKQNRRLLKDGSPRVGYEIMLCCPTGQ